MVATRDLPVPRFYDAKHAERWDYAPDSQRLFTDAADWRRTHGVKPAASDKFNLHVLVIDAQKDFCFPQGTLYVAGRDGRGAIEDNKRTAAWIYRNLARVTNLTTTMDTHFAYQIFFPAFWVDRDDRPLGSFREITSDEVGSGAVRPNPAIAKWLCNGNYSWLVQQTRYYCGELEKAGKYKLYLWPSHCLLGSDGHALAGILHEARMFHSFVRGAQSWVEVKGGNPLTENYSVLRPEVLTRFDGRPLAQRNTLFLQTLLTSDAVVIAGQAASHCVKSSIDDLLGEIVAQDPGLAKKVYILTDCMSAVTVPDGKGGFAVDFSPQADAALKKFADAGMHLVRSTDPIESGRESGSIEENAMSEIQRLFQAAHADGELSDASMQALAIPDLGAQIQAALGTRVEDVAASEVVLVTMMIDDSGSIRFAGNAQAVRDGHNLVLDSLRGSRQRDGILVHTRYLNGEVLYPYCPVDRAVQMDSHNYDPQQGTPLYDQSVVLLATVLAKAREFADNGVPVRTVTLIISDGADMHSVRSSAQTVASLVSDLRRAESHIVAAMGVDDGSTDFHAVFRQMNIEQKWILTPGENATDIRRAFQMFSQSAVKAASGAAMLGGFSSP